MLTSFIGGFFNYLKGFIIGLKYSSTDLAFSTKGEQIPSVAVNNLYSAIESVLFSTVSRLNSEPERIKAFVKNVLSILTFCIMPLMFGVIACADNIVAVLYTDKWAPIVPYLRILSFQYAFSIVGTLNLLIINARGRSDISLKLEIIKKPVYVLFIFIGMMFGPLYIILANALYTVFGIIINTIPNKKLVNYGLLEQVKDIMPNIISALIMMIVTMLIGRLEMNNTIVLLLLQVILGAIVYVSLQILLKNDNIKIIVSFLKKIAFKYILKKGNKSAS
jgi:O-antigen/teichoic acid export membrane protein